MNWLFLFVALIGSASLSAEAVKGIALVSSEDSLTKEELKELRGIDSFGLDLPGSHAELTKQLSPFLGKEVDFATTKEITQAIYAYYQKRNHPFILVSAPISEDGAFQFVIQESKLGRIGVSGNEWTQTSRYKNYFTLQPGDRISMKRLSSDVNFMNRNPFRRVDIVYSPGEKKNTTDISLLVEDRKPYRFYTGFDNTGVPTTGRSRVLAGFSWDQIFNLDQVFFYQYTTNYHVNRYHSNTFQYMALLPWKSVLQLYGGYSIVQSDLQLPNRNNEGTNIQGSLRYTLPFADHATFSQELIFGLDIKNTNNTMEFVDFTPTFGMTVNLSQLVFGYKAQYERTHALYKAGVDCYASPGDWLPNQSNTNFESLRPGAKNTWIYGRGYFRAEHFYSNFSYAIDLRGQLSSQTLLPSEQLGIGGYDTVRGYDERQYNGDSGAIGSLEVHTPTFSPIRRHGKNLDRAYFLLFLDAGFGYDYTAVPEIPNSNFLIGIGPGVRYSIGPYFTAKVDWGVKLHRQDNFTGGWSQIHFSVIGSF